MRYLLVAVVLLAGCAPQSGAPAKSGDKGQSPSEMTLVREMRGGDTYLVRHESGRCFIASGLSNGHGRYTWVYSQVDREMCAEPAK